MNISVSISEFWVGIQLFPAENEKCKHFPVLLKQLLSLLFEALKDNHTSKGLCISY